MLSAVSAPPVPTAPAVDHHQHLFSPATAALIGAVEIDAGALIGELDAAGMGGRRCCRRPTSSAARIAPSSTSTSRCGPPTTGRAGRWPDFRTGCAVCCGLNPLRDYALEELARGAQDRHLRSGLKLHFGNSAVDYHDARHVAQLRRVFEAANGLGMAIVVHMRASISRRLPYGRDEARIFLDDLLPAAPDVPVQIAHLSGAGGFGDDPPLDRALEVFVEAIAGGDPRAARLLFDVATSVTPKAPPEERARIARRLRAARTRRVLYGSDAATPGNSPRDGGPRSAACPLSAPELSAIAGNVAPYVR